MTPEQCKMARAGLGWSVQRLGEQAGTTPNTVSRFENGRGDAFTSTANKFKAALESSGKIKFEGEHCVCLVPSDKAE